VNDLNSVNGNSKRMVKRVFIVLAVLPLLLFLCALNQWLPDIGQFKKVGGVPFSIFAVLVLLFGQVALAWVYLRLYEHKGDAGK